MGGGSILGGENLSGDDESGAVRSEVGEEKEKRVEDDEKSWSVGGLLGPNGDDLRVGGGQDQAQKENDAESHDLNGLSSPNIDKGHGYEISGYSSGQS